MGTPDDGDYSNPEDVSPREVRWRCTSYTPWQTVRALWRISWRHSRRKPQHTREKNGPQAAISVCEEVRVDQIRGCATPRTDRKQQYQSAKKFASIRFAVAPPQERTASSNISLRRSSRRSDSRLRHPKNGPRGVDQNDSNKKPSTRMNACWTGPLRGRRSPPAWTGGRMGHRASTTISGWTGVQRPSRPGARR